ncbi:MAG TPA: sulfite exporter TauE/SafE family protein, partial [Usitatibacter sp.]|nr:sulfite exporter TauE/SafE family protein [Usitatibacter sp.]
MTFDLLVGAVAFLAGIVAAVSGFGIGSLLTPTFALHAGTKAAVAAVAIPHVIGTLQRFWILRRHVDRRMLLAFGLTSAAGGLAGALAHVWLSSRYLTIVFGVLLILAAIAEATGWMAKVHWGRRTAWIAGALSGVFGGLVGNQGSIRSAAMLGFDVPKESFVATATA